MSWETLAPAALMVVVMVVILWGFAVALPKAAPCWICGQRIDPDISAPDPRSRVIDYIIPLEHGGLLVGDNRRAAHLGCVHRKDFLRSFDLSW